MQTTRIVQAVVLMTIVALAASCAASKEYSSKLFSPRNENLKESKVMALRFLELDSLQSEKDGWVSTDIIMGRDTGNKSIALDNLAKVFPPVSVKRDTITTSKEDLPAGQAGKAIPVYVVTKPLTVEDLPIAKNYDPIEVRNKKIREK